MFILAYFMKIYKFGFGAKRQRVNLPQEQRVRLRTLARGAIAKQYLPYPRLCDPHGVFFTL